MAQITLPQPDLTKIATAKHPDFPKLQEAATRKVGTDMVDDVHGFCDWVVSTEFMVLLNSLQIGERLPDIGDCNIDASNSSKRVMEFTIPQGHDRAEIRGIIEKAWVATAETYGEALYLRIRDLANGKADPGWTPASHVPYPTI